MNNSMLTERRFSDPPASSPVSETGERKVFEEWVGEAPVFGFEILPQPPEKALHLIKNLAGALPTDGVGCTLSVG
jgi:hypothetical protein